MSEPGIPQKAPYPVDLEAEVEMEAARAVPVHDEAPDRGQLEHGIRCLCYSI